MRISVSEWTALRLALKLPRSLVNPELLPAAIREHAFTRRGIAIAAFVLLALLVFLHVKAADPGVKRLTELVAQLTGARLIDARWDAATATGARGEAGTAKSAVQPNDLARIHRALDAAAPEAKTTAVRTAIADLRKAYTEKADVVGRLERASADSRQALAGAMRADAAITMLIRNAWREFPQRERLVAAENLALRVIVEAQQYTHAPSAAHRTSLASYAADLPKAQSLPKPVQAGLASLENDVHQILLLKPLEQMLAERLITLRTGPRLDELNELFDRELTDAIVWRDRYRIALLVYAALLAALLAWLGVRAIAKYRDLEVLYAGQTRELAKALRKLRTIEDGAAPDERRRPEPVPAHEEARIVSEHRRSAP